MNNELSPEAVEFGGHVRRALEAAGGDTLVQQAEADPTGRAALVEPVLAELGVWDLDPRAGGDELEAAAVACRSAGWWAAPYPVAERLAGTLVVAEHAPAAAIDGLGQSWTAVSTDGRRFRGTARPAIAGPRATAFVTAVDLEPLDDGDGDADLALGLVLAGWTLLGMLDRAIALTVDHVRDRHQFGQPLSSFQSVQFQLTDAEVERSGLEELALHSLWSLEARPDQAVDDAVALRLAALDAAEVVFRVTHQLHGATGFCDETTLSWLSRYSQPLRRLPLGPSGTRDLLARRLGRRGLAGLFG